MRIAIDARTIADHFPGIARYTYNLVLALADMAPHDELLLLHDPRQPNTRFDLSVLCAKPNVQLVAVSAPPFAWSAQWRVPAALDALRADVYHSCYYIMPYWTRRPTLVTIYDFIPLRYPQYFSRVQRLIFGAASRLAVRSAKRSIAISHATAADMQRFLHVPTERIVVTPLAPDPNMRRASAAAIANVRTRYRLPDTFTLYVGSNKPHKNLVRLIEAYARIASRVPLVIAGHWDASHPDAKQRAERLGLADVRWLGPMPQADLAALYSAATLFVFPSECEGFGLPVIEAMACGTPVVTSNVSSLLEATGDAALLVYPYDVSAIADAIARVLNDAALREQLRERGLERAKEFSWNTVAQQTCAAYQQVLDSAAT